MSETPMVLLKGRDEATERLRWEEQVMARYRRQCSCGSTARIRVCFVVPPEAGGTLTEANGYVICRACEMTRDLVHKAATTERQPINFWVSRALYTVLERRTTGESSFRSMGELIRYLISFYLRCSASFDDLENYQDVGSDVKINAWVSEAEYKEFKTCLAARNMTVTDALKALILFYDVAHPSEVSEAKESSGE